jgi:uncharacterized protein YndB with AHSA1/START domain
MQAKIEKHGNEYLVTYERHLEHSIEDVWAMLTDNKKLALWFDELRVARLGKGGYLNFDMGDGTFQRMDITDFKEYHILEFTWDENLVRFELTPESNHCNLVFTETITELTTHTPKDLAGWHVCLDVIGMLLDKKEVNDRMENWKYWFEIYTKAIESLT